MSNLESQVKSKSGIPTQDDFIIIMSYKSLMVIELLFNFQNQIGFNNVNRLNHPDSSGQLPDKKSEDWPIRKDKL